MGEEVEAFRCDDCGNINPCWYAPSPVWNFVIGGPDAEGDPGGMICPNCFLKRADAVWSNAPAEWGPAIWRLAPETDHDREQSAKLHALRASLTRVEEERDDLRQSVIAFAGPHAARYAEEFGFAPNELHPTHYDLLEKCGARMDSFKRADLSRADGPQAKAEDAER